MAILVIGGPVWSIGLDTLLVAIVIALFVGYWLAQTLGIDCVRLLDAFLIGRRRRNNEDRASDIAPGRHARRHHKSLRRHAS